RPHDNRPARGVKTRRPLRLADHGRVPRRILRDSPMLADQITFRNKIPETRRADCLCNGMKTPDHPIMTTNSTLAALRNPAGLLLALLALFLIPVDLFAWTNGELLIWMDADRGQALKAIAAKKFENDFGLKVTIEASEK